MQVDNDMMESDHLDTDSIMQPVVRPDFAPLSVNEMAESQRDLYRKVPIPPHRMTPLRDNWLKIYSPLVEHMKLQIRFNTKSKSVEIKVFLIFMIDLRGNSRNWILTESSRFCVRFRARFRSRRCFGTFKIRRFIYRIF